MLVTRAQINNSITRYKVKIKQIDLGNLVTVFAAGCCVGFITAIILFQNA